MLLFLLGTFNCFTVLSEMHFSVKPVFHDESVLEHGHFRNEINILHLICKEPICPDYKNDHNLFLQQFEEN